MKRLIALLFVMAALVTFGVDIVLVTPDNGQTYSGIVTLKAAGWGGPVSNVLFYVDGTLIATDVSAPFETTYNTAALANGSHVFTAAGKDASGAWITPAGATVTILNSSLSVTLTSPTNSTFLNTTVVFSATASGSSTITNVQWFLNDALTTNDTTSPYSQSIAAANFASGVKTCYAKAFDNVGNTALSGTNTFTVDTLAPTNTLTAPTNGATVSTTFQITATATDNIGVVNVEFYRDGATLIGNDTSSPYSIGVTLATGAHTLYAKAYDAAGNSKLSGTNTVTVSTSAGANQWALTVKGTISGDSAQLTGISTDSSGNVFVAGPFSGNVNAGGGSITSFGYNDVILAKFNSSGTFTWQKRYGGPLIDAANGCAVDSNGDVFVTGYFTGTSDYGGGNMTSAGNYDIFLAKYSGVNGTNIWQQRFGTSTAGEIAYCICVDSSGNVYIGGYAPSAIDFGAGPVSGSGSAFIAGFSTSGTLLWAKHTGGSVARGIAADVSGNVVITGEFTGTTDFGGGGVTAVGGLDIYLSKYSSAGAYTWTKTFGSTSTDKGFGVAVSTNGDVSMTGSFINTINFGGGSIGITGAGSIVVGKFTAASGAYIWARAIGSGSGSAPLSVGVTVDASDSTILAADALGAEDFGGGFLTGNGSWNPVLIKYGYPTGQYLWGRRFLSTGDAHNKAVTHDSSGNLLISGSFGPSIDFGSGAVTSSATGSGYGAKFSP